MKKNCFRIETEINNNRTEICSNFVDSCRGHFAKSIKLIVAYLLPSNVRFVSAAADKWFRNIVTENRKSRLALDTPRNDFMQIMLNVAQKMGTIARHFQEIWCS